MQQQEVLQALKGSGNRPAMMTVWFDGTPAFTWEVHVERKEDRTHFRVIVPNAVGTFRIGQRDRRICVGLRGLHIQRRMN